MSTNVGAINYKLSLDTSEFDRQASNISQKTKDIGSSMTSVGKRMTLGLTLPIAIGMGVAVKAASDLNETINKVEVAFGNSSVAVKKWSETSISKMGLAKQSALDAAALFGDMATSMGLPQAAAADMSMSLVQLGADLSSFKNIPIQEAQTALAGVFTGETESLKRLGIVMTETNLLEYAKAKGITKTVQEMTQAEKVQLRYNYIMDKTKNSQGDFIRTSSGTANQIRQTQERFKELSAQLGANLLPIVNKLLTFVQKVMKAFSELSPRLQNIILIIGGVLAVAGPLLIFFGMLATAVAAISWPVLAVVAVIGTLIAVVVYLQTKFQAFTPIIEFLRLLFITVWGQIKIAFEQVRAALEPFMPQLMLLAKIIGVVVLIPIIAFVGAVLGAIAVLGVLIAVVARVIGYFVQFAVAIGRAFWSVQMALVNTWKNIIGVFAGAEKWLFNAGKAIMTGLLNGLKSSWETTAKFLSGLGNKIKNLKGPLNKDKILLINEGNAIMQGLDKGIKGGYGAVANTLSNITSNIPKQVSANIAMTGGGQAPTNTTTIQMGDIHIADKQTADYFFGKLNRNGELARKGLATA